MRQVAAHFDLRILQQYTLAGLLASTLIGIHYITNVFRGSYELLGLEMQAFSFLLLGVVMMTSLIGIAFHQANVQSQARNSYAVIFMGGLTKLLLLVALISTLA